MKDVIIEVGNFFADNMLLYLFYGFAFLIASFKTYEFSRKLIVGWQRKMIISISLVFLFTFISFATCYMGWARPEITTHAEMTEIEKLWIATSYIFDGITLLPLILLFGSFKNK